MGIAVGISLLSCIEANKFHVQMCIHVFPVSVPPSWISKWYRRVLPLTKTSFSSPNIKSNIKRYFIQPYYVYQGCLLCATILLILDKFRQSKLLIWRHVYWGHVMLKPWEFICAKSPKTFLSYLFRQKSFTQQRVLWGYFPFISNTRVKCHNFWQPVLVNFNVLLDKKVFRVLWHAMQLQGHEDGIIISSVSGSNKWFHSTFSARYIWAAQP